MVKAGQRRTEIRAPHSLFTPSDDADGSTAGALDDVRYETGAVTKNVGQRRPAQDIADDASFPRSVSSLAIPRR
jgi:hypothetical protein